MNPIETAALNLEGEICPYPLILTIKKAEEIKKDLAAQKKTIEVITDCYPATENIPAEFRKRGFFVEIEEIGPAKWKIIIKAK